MHSKNATCRLYNPQCFNIKGELMKFFGLVSLVLISSSSVFADARDAEDFGKFNYNFNQLPLEGSIPAGTKAWSGDYWAFKFGNINLRWNTASPTGYNLNSPAKERALKMSESELAKLAPSEKWSLYKGDYDYNLVHEVGSYTGSRKKLWAGICHGWAPASLHHSEPTPKTLVNKDGIKVPFGSGDIKGILSYFYADVGEGTHQLGGKCHMGRWVGMGGCGGDVNPAALHVLMANKFGLQKEGLLMDRDPGKEVWNQPVSGFKAKVVKGPYKSGNGFEVLMSADLIWTDESRPTWAPVFGTDNQKSKAMALSYSLKLDANYTIVDGAWRSDTYYPDFVWIAPKITEYRDQWAGLENLLND
jgi:Transglutaminase elicitor